MKRLMLLGEDGVTFAALARLACPYNPCAHPTRARTVMLDPDHGAVAV